MKPKRFNVHNFDGRDLLVEVTPETYVINGEKTTPQQTDQLDGWAFADDSTKMAIALDDIVGEPCDTSAADCLGIIAYVRRNYTPGD